MGVFTTRSAWRWLMVPWREPALALALVGAAAAPVMLVASADVWRAASQDDVAARAVADESLTRNGVDVLLETAFTPAGTTRADEALRDSVAEIDDVAELRRSAYTLSGLLTLGPPPLRTVGPSGQLFAEDGALEAIEVVDRLDDTDGGVWITTWFANRHEIELGDGIAFEAGAIVDEQWNDLVRGGGADAVLRVVGTYEPLWSPDRQPSPFWAGVPPEVLPSFIDAFGAPNKTLIIADESTVLDSGLTGVLRWRAPLTDIPDTFDELLVRNRQFRRFETALVGTGELGQSMVGASTEAGRRPILTTDFFDTIDDARRAARRLDAPLAAARGVGGIVGLAAALAVGVFFVERRRTEFRLLASEGEGSVRIGVRVAAQLAPPFLLGVAVGIAGALVGPRWYGPADGFDWSAIAWRPVLLVALGALALAAAAAGVLGARTLTRADRSVQASVGRALAVVIAIAAVGAWVQVGRTAAVSDELDLVVVALPVLSILVATAVVLLLAGRVLGIGATSASWMPTEIYLAVRRLARGSGGVRIAAGALGVGIGLLVFATALTSTLDRTVDVKLATEIGGETSVRLVDDLPPDFVPPAPSTLVRVSDTSLSPGDVSTRIIAIDTDTFGAAVTWSDQFDADLDAVLADVSGPFGAGVPVVGVTGEPAPSVGAFGITRAFQYRTVDRIAAFPAAGERVTSLLASAASIDAYAATSRGYDSVEDAAADGFAFPVNAYRRVLISQSNADELTAALDAAGVRYREVDSQSARRQEPSIVATRAAFSYLGVIGIVALVAALTSLALFLSARRRHRALTGVMTRSMGLTAARAALVSAVELAAVLALSVGAAFVAVPLVVRRVSGRFDPAPDRPPEVPVLVSWPPLVIGAVVGTLAICALVWWSEWLGGRRPAGEVLRDGG